MLEQAIADYLPELRREAEARMVDTGRLTEPGDGEPVFNEDTGQYDYPDAVTVYEGRCRSRMPRAEERTVDVAERQATLQEIVISLPIEGTEGARIGQTFTYLTSERDQALVGRVFTVVGLHLQTDSTARRLLCRTGTG